MVSVLDDTGNEYLFRNAGGGRYLSDSTEFRATAGRKYKLHVEGPDIYTNLTLWR